LAALLYRGYQNRRELGQLLQPHGKEATEMFQQIIAKRNIEKEALDNFTLAKQQQENGVVLENHKLFIISFETKNRLRFLQKMKTKKKRKKAETTARETEAETATEIETGAPKNPDNLFLSRKIHPKKNHTRTYELQRREHFVV
jgi:hypothetical protein